MLWVLGQCWASCPSQPWGWVMGCWLAGRCPRDEVAHDQPHADQPHCALAHFYKPQAACGDIFGDKLMTVPAHGCVLGVRFQKSVREPKPAGTDVVGVTTVQSPSANNIYNSRNTGNRRSQLNVALANATLFCARWEFALQRVCSFTYFPTSSLSLSLRT